MDIAREKKEVKFDINSIGGYGFLVAYGLTST